MFIILRAMYFLLLTVLFSILAFGSANAETWAEIIQGKPETRKRNVPPSRYRKKVTECYISHWKWIHNGSRQVRVPVTRCEEK